jgi:hypothetical protein
VPCSCAIHASPKSTASARRRSSDEEDDEGAPCDEEAPEDGVGGPARLEHERDREDRCHIGDGDLGDHDHRLWAVEPSLLEGRQDDGRRAGGQKDGVDGDMARAGDLGDHQAAERRDQPGHRRRERAPGEAAAQAPVAQRDVHANGQHQHREAGIGQERERRVVGVDDVHAAATEDDAREDLADHHGHERAPAGREQRPGQTGSHDQREVAEGHRASLRARCSSAVRRRSIELRGDLRGSSSPHDRAGCRPSRGRGGRSL